jgi:predicted transport protein
MTKRQLNAEEKRLALKSLDMLDSDIEYLEKVQIANKQFSLNTADIVVAKQKKDIALELKILTDTLNQKKEVAAELRKQLKEGVEIIEPKKEVKKK